MLGKRCQKNKEHKFSAKQRKEKDTLGQEFCSSQEKLLPGGWTAAPVFVLIYNGGIFGDYIAKRTL